MGTEVETLVYSIEARKNTTALDSAFNEMLGLTTVIKSANAAIASAETKQAQATTAASKALTIHGQSALQTATRLRGAAQTAGNLATQMTMMGGSMQSAGMAAATLAGQIAMTTKNVQVMVGATAIGFAAVVLGGFIQKLNEANEAAARLAAQRFDAFANSLVTEQQKTVLAGLRAERAELMKVAESGDLLYLKKNTWYNYDIKSRNDVLKLIDENLRREELLTKEITAGDTKERQRLDLFAEQVGLQVKAAEAEAKVANLRKTAAGEGWRATDFMIRGQQMLDEREAAEDQVRQQFRIRDAHGKIIELTDVQVKLQQRLLDAVRSTAAAKVDEANKLESIDRAMRAHEVRKGASDSRENIYNSRLAEIDFERRAEIEKTGDVENANARSQQRIRQMRRETFKAAITDYKTIVDVARDSGSKQVRAIGNAAESVRRLIIGAEAAHAAVKAIKEGAASIESLGVGDFRGAALHAAASAQYGAAAALGARESLGGGAGGSAGGGAGAGSGTFIRDDAGRGGGSLTINVITQRALGQAEVQTLRYELDRAKLLNRPIDIPVSGSTGVMVSTG